MIIWNEYRIFDPGVMGPVYELSRSDARNLYKLRMESRAERAQLLRDLLRTNGLLLGPTTKQIQQLNDWFSDNAEVDPQCPGRLVADWYSVVNDIALYIGDMMTARNPSLYWAFSTKGGRRDAAYQRHVVAGFTKGSYPDAVLNLDRHVSAYANQIAISGDRGPGRDLFVRLVEWADERA